MLNEIKGFHRRDVEAFELIGKKKEEDLTLKEMKISVIFKNKEKKIFYSNRYGYISEV